MTIPLSRMAILSWLFALLFVTTGAALEVPSLTGPVVDVARVLSSDRHSRLEKVLRDVEARGTAQIQVLILPSLEGEPIETFSIRVVDEWKLGKSGKDNGILLLVSIGDRRNRIEVGRGLEGDLPDVIVKRILADVMRPYFKNGLIEEGIAAGVMEILKYADPEIAGSEGASLRREAPLSLRDVGAFVLFLLVMIFLMGPGRWGRRAGLLGGIGGLGGFGGPGFGRGGGWGGGSSWGGGGGGFSGGGASDGW